MATPRKTAQKTTQKSTQSRTTAKRAPSSRARQNGSKPKPQRQSLREIAISAAQELAQLIGHTPEAIVAVEKRDEGWLVQVQVVESRRIPATTDIMAVYEVEVGDDGAVTGYRRADRYVRGRIQE